MPPDVDDLTVEKQFDDHNLGILVVSDVAGTLEITIPVDNDISIMSDEKKEKNYRKRKREISVVWTNEIPTYTFRALENSSKRNSDILTAEANHSPVDLFEDFCTESVYDMILEETNR